MSQIEAVSQKLKNQHMIWQTKLTKILIQPKIFFKKNGGIEGRRYSNN
jgi:hypothetical protein